jgi:protein-disulfide isomerase
VGLIVLGAVLRGGDSTIDRSAAYREGRIYGLLTAPVVISVWEDFQCPACKNANNTVLAQIERDYVEPGIVQVHFRHFAFLGQESVWAAEASECAADQGLFWEYHDALFVRQGGENRGAFSRSNLQRMASEVGLDADRFQQCFDGGVFKAAIEAERAEGTRLGVQGTPTFFVNDVRIADWRSYDAFKTLIERALAGGS